MRLARRKEPRLAEQDRGKPSDRTLPGRERPGEAGVPPGGRRRDAFPEGTQPVDTVLRRIAGNDRSVDRVDRNASNPVMCIVRGGEGLVDAGLVAAEGAAALEDEPDLLIVRRRPWPLLEIRHRCDSSRNEPRQRTRRIGGVAATFQCLGRSYLVPMA